MIYAKVISGKELMSEKILIASDHGGYELKAAIQAELSAWKWEDLGPHQSDAVDYPDFALSLAKKVSDGQAQRGILICGSGIGMGMAANKVEGVRAAVVSTPELAHLSREHNDANVLCLAGRFLETELAVQIAKTWLKTPFSGDERHIRRIEKMRRIERGSRKDE